MKRVIFDVGHPAQVHNFKILHKLFINNGWNSRFTIKSKDVALALIKSYKIPHFILFSNTKNRIINLGFNILNLVIFLAICLSFRPDFVVSRGSIHAVIICKLFFIKHIILSDTEHSRVFYKYANVLITGKSYRKSYGDNHIKINANIELFYLHPKYFRNPSRPFKNCRKKVLIRFVSWDAHHDKGMSGLSLAQKIKAVEAFSKHAEVYISSEKILNESLNSYAIKISPEDIHSFMSSCNLVYGESATMASEAAVIGVPAIYHDNYGRGYTDEEQSYGLVYNYKESVEEQNLAIKKGIEILNLQELEIKERHQRFMSDKIDPVKFLYWFIENYPESMRIIKECPDYQFNFK